MRTSLCLVMFFLSVLVGLPHVAAAPPVASPAIQSVTLEPDAGVLTITGTGLGADLVAIIDGQPVTVLPGATATRMEVQFPATVLAAPGTYRLTVVDPVRRVGDVFVVASQGGVAGGVIEAGRTPSTSSVRGPSSPASAIGGASTPETAAYTRSASTPSPMVFEGVDNTAIGSGALASNPTGHYNTASGAQALYSNTIGSKNAAHGVYALYANTTGGQNTASGEDALFSNIDGWYNTASGRGALYSNTTGTANTASGQEAMYANTTGGDNTASGVQALFSNTTGNFNTASGTGALFSNTVGTNNVATGVQALYLNTVGNDNTATGTSALYNSTASFNTADGTSALYNMTTGGWNVAVGDRAGSNATTGSYNVFLGAGVYGMATDTNTIRLGLPYDGVSGQNRTFIAGIYGTQLTGPTYQVVVNANGRLGMVTPPITLQAGGSLTSGPLQVQLQREQQINAEQQEIIADLRSRLARVEALLQSISGRK